LSHEEFLVRVQRRCAAPARAGPGVNDGDARARHGRGLVLRERALPRAVPVTRDALREFADRHGASATVRESVALAVTEACSNVVVHAYVEAEAAGHLEVRARVQDNELIVQVSDQGRGMRPRPDSPGLGMGLALIAQMAETFEVLDHRDRPGVTVRMHFSLAGAR
jgi:serine/threonine-protein kinase RsbW